MEAIILCGGSAWRLKPDTSVPKPKLKINGETLISHQIGWLRRQGVNKITLAADSPNLTDDPQVIHSVEEKKLGTGGAVKKAAEHIKEKRVYVMNVDDIVFYDPKQLYEYADKGAAKTTLRQNPNNKHTRRKIRTETPTKLLCKRRTLRLQNITHKPVFPRPRRHGTANTPKPSRQKNDQRIPLQRPMANNKHNERPHKSKRTLRAPRQIEEQHHSNITKTEVKKWVRIRQSVCSFS